MAFDYTKFERWSASVGVGINAQWAYTKTDETMATIVASAYFDDLIASTDSLIKVNDIIWVQASDAQQFVTVATIVAPVTVTPFSVVLGAGSVGTSNIANLAVTTAKIDNLAVTTGKIADEAVTSAKLEDLLVHHARVTMTEVDWDAMNVTPFELVAAPGVTEKLLPMRVVVNEDYGGTVFAAGGAIHVQYDTTTAGAGPKATGTYAAATFIGQVADTTFAFTPVDTSLVDSTTLGKSLCLSNATAPFTGGTASAFIVDVWYAIADYA